MIRPFIIVILIFSNFISISQPVLDSANTSPQIGETFTRNTCYYISPGSVGANQTWNLSSMVMQSSTPSDVVNPNTTPDFSLFQNSDISITPTSSGIYSYFSLSSNLYQLNGTSNSSFAIVYDNPSDELRFPLNYQDQFLDTFSGQYINGVVYERFGTNEVHADGYGTLILPNGTFSNVLRVHVVKQYQDSSQSNVINFNYNGFHWYLPGTHNPIAIVYSITNSSGTTLGSNYLVEINLSSNEMEPGNQMIVFPNPASNIISFYTDGLIRNGSFRIYNSIGEQIIFGEGHPNEKIDITILKPGYYFLTIVSEEGQTISQGFIKN